MGTLVGHHSANPLPCGRIDHHDMVAAHDRDQNHTVVPHHARRGLADSGGPTRFHANKVERDQCAGILHRTEHGFRIRRVAQMAWHRADLKSMRKGEGGGMIDIDMVEPQAVDGEIPAIRAEPKLIRVGDQFMAAFATGDRIKKKNCVARSVADQECLVIRRERPVAWLAKGRFLA